MTPQQQIEDLLTFIDSSPSPWHVIASLELRLAGFGFQRLRELDPWSLSAGGRYYVVRDDSSIIIFVIGNKSLIDSGFKIVGAHTDSPGLRLKPQPILNDQSVTRLAVEVYGGPILATFSDRDLSLAGRVAFQTETGAIVSRLLHFEQPLLRLPNLAIHMNRMVNEEGLKFNKQTELPLLFATTTAQQLPDEKFQTLIGQATDLVPEQILSWEFNIYDTQKGVLWGENQAFYANSQLDNLASCHAGISALLDESVLKHGNTQICAFFDHEEIGSESCKGADSGFLADTLERISICLELNKQDYQRSLANSFLISADMAHAYQPNFPNAYETGHKVFVNHGPVIKINSNQRYATSCLSEARFAQLCQQVEVPFQRYAHRGDLPCGSTIGPITSARLGIPTVDIGNPMWAMHSIRESAGVLDQHYLIKVLSQFFTSA